MSSAQRPCETRRESRPRLQIIGLRTASWQSARAPSSAAAGRSRIDWLSRWNSAASSYPRRSTSSTTSGAVAALPRQLLQRVRRRALRAGPVGPNPRQMRLARLRRPLRSASAARASRESARMCAVGQPVAVADDEIGLASDAWPRSRAAGRDGQSSAGSHFAGAADAATARRSSLAAPSMPAARQPRCRPEVERALLVVGAIA